MPDAYKFYGNTPGTVVRAEDPLQRGRIMVTVPDICTDAWASPCTPLAGPGAAFKVIPPNGASVWVEFEAGEPDKPILAGYDFDPPLAFRLATEVEVSPDVLLLSYGRCAIRMDNQGLEISNGETSLKMDATGLSAVYGGTKLAVTQQAVEMAVGGSTSISLKATEASFSASTVDINNGALQVK